MTEKGGHFGRALVLALAAHALLFLLFAQLVRNAVVVAGARAQPVEIELAGPGSPGPPGASAPGALAPVGTRAPGSHRSGAAAPPVPAMAPQAHSPRPVAPTAHSALQARVRGQTQLPVQQPAEASTAAPAPVLSTQPAPDLPAPPLSSSGSGLPGTGNGWGDSPEGSGTSEGGNGGGSANGSSGGSFPAAISDIDPTPLQPLTAPYPAGARRLGQQGLAKIRADIDVQGFVVSCQVVASSGYDSLDKAAVQAVQSTRFLPARKNGRTVASSIIIPVRFKLTQD
jgi:periplasmic protein TonB